MVQLYKVHILSHVEFRTAAIAHAATLVLAPLDNLQRRFLRDISISEEDALLRFRLAPLAVRRDIALLGLVHRAALGIGPLPLQQIFRVDMGSAPPRARRHMSLSRRASLCTWCTTLVQLAITRYCQ
eukprot:6413038-Alexandrium_andersonii.AAC.1